MFDEWKELKGHRDKSIQFVFNDLDPTDAVDYRKLLIELHDRELISRSSLQLKMDLDPEIEASNREREHKVNLFDKEQTSPVNDLVLSGVLPVEQVRELLGIKPGNENPYAAGGVTFASLEEPERTGDEMCDDCFHFDRENPRCNVRNEDRPFDADPCEHFSMREI